MPYPFPLPTTSSFSYSSCFDCESHPSLPLNASTHRAVVRNILKKYKRLPPQSQVSNLPSVVSALTNYAPYPLLFDAVISSRPHPGADLVSIIPKSHFDTEWRPTLSGEVIPGKERSRVKVTALGDEASFVLSTLAFAYSLQARYTLQPLYSVNSDFLGAQERNAAITSASKSLLDAASIWLFVASLRERDINLPPCADVGSMASKGLASLAHAEATLLAVLKDDPYPTAVAQDRNKNDKEWMFKAPEIPKVRAHLYARLSLAASEHAAKAASLLQSAGNGRNKINGSIITYINNVRQTSRAKACRFFGIDAELGGETAEGIGWVRAGLQELGVEVKDTKKGLSLSKLRKDFTEKREDRRVDKAEAWGADGGKLEETRVLQMLDEKWNKMNDTMNTKAIPPATALLPKMPSGREIHTVKPMDMPTLGKDAMEAMRVSPSRADHYGDDISSDEDAEAPPTAPGAFPDRSASSSTYY